MPVPAPASGGQRAIDTVPPFGESLVKAHLYAATQMDQFSRLAQVAGVTCKRRKSPDCIIDRKAVDWRIAVVRQQG